MLWLAADSQPARQEKPRQLPDSLNHHQRRTRAPKWTSQGDHTELLPLQCRWGPRNTLPLKTKLRRRVGYIGIRVGEAAHPGPSCVAHDGWEWSSGEEEMPETQRKKRPKKRTHKKGCFAHARKAARSRAKKVRHVIALKKSFFEGLRGAPMSKSGFTHSDAATFDYGVWKDV